MMQKKTCLALVLCGLNLGANSADNRYEPGVGGRAGTIRWLTTVMRQRTPEEGDALLPKSMIA